MGSLYRRHRFPPENHQPRRLAVPSVRSQLSRCRGPSRRAWHHGVLRSDSILVPEVWPRVRPHIAAAARSSRRHLARGRSVHHHPRRTPLSLESRGPGWRDPRYPGHAPQRQESCVVRQNFVADRKEDRTRIRSGLWGCRRAGRARQSGRPASTVLAVRGFLHVLEHPSPLPLPHRIAQSTNRDSNA